MQLDTLNDGMILQQRPTDDVKARWKPTMIDDITSLKNKTWCCYRHLKCMYAHREEKVTLLVKCQLSNVIGSDSPIIGSSNREHRKNLYIFLGVKCVCKVKTKTTTGTDNDDSSRHRILRPLNEQTTCHITHILRVT